MTSSQPLTEEILSFIKSHHYSAREILTSLLKKVTSSNFIQNTMETFGTRVLLAIIGAVFPIIYARILGPREYGFLAIASLITALGIQFGNLGLSSTNTYLVSRERKLLPLLTGNSFLISLLAGGFIGITIKYIFWINPNLKVLSPYLLNLALLGIPLGLVTSFLLSLLIGLQKIRQFNVLQLIVVGVTLVVISIFLLLKLLTKENIITFTVFISIFYLILLSLCLHQELLAPPQISFKIFRNHFFYGFKIYLGCFFAFLVLRVDIFLVKYFLGTESTGHYSVASTLANGIYILPQTAGMILFPKLCSVEEKRHRWDLTRKVSRIVLLITCPLIILAMALANPFFKIFLGPKYNAAIFPFMLLAIAILFYSLNAILDQFIASMGMPAWTIAVWVSAAALNIGLNFYWIRNFGIAGAAFVSIITYAYVYFSNYYLITRKILRHGL